MISVKGIGWITQDEYGGVMQKLRRNYNERNSLHSQLRDESVFLYPVKNFGRFNEVSKRTCCAAALALQDAGISYTKDCKQDIGIIGTNVNGCLKSNLNYFNDYVQAGRVMARGNLFIYTLPSSPLAEAAICLGLQGPLLYINFPQKQISSLLRYVEKIVVSHESSVMLALHVDETEGMCFVLKQENDNHAEKSYLLEKVIALTEEASNPNELIRKFTHNLI